MDLLRTTWTPGPRSMIVPLASEPASPLHAEPSTWHLLSIKEIASACQLSEKAVRRAIDDGELPAVKLRSRLRVTPQDFEAWVAGRQRQRRSRSERSAAPRLPRRAPLGTFRALAQTEPDREVSQ